MITDKLNMFAEDQADVRAANTYLCDKSIDLGSKGYMAGDPPYVYVKVGTAFAGGTSVDFQLVMADDAALTSNKVVLQTSGAIVTASLTAASIPYKAKLPISKITKRYLGMQAVSVGVHTTGDFTAGLADEVPNYTF